MTTYAAEICGEVLRLRANFSQASCEILRDDEDGRWCGTGKQVADFGHRPKDAMRWELERYVDDDDNLIENAVAEMSVTEERWSNG